VGKWADSQCSTGARSALQDSSEGSVVIEAGKFDHASHAGTEVLGPLQTKDGISFKRVDGKFRLKKSRDGRFPDRRFHESFA
jgi:hypothetical protein